MKASIGRWGDRGQMVEVIQRAGLKRDMMPILRPYGLDSDAVETLILGGVRQVTPVVQAAFDDEQAGLDIGVDHGHGGVVAPGPIGVLPDQLVPVSRERAQEGQAERPADEAQALRGGERSLLLAHGDLFLVRCRRRSL